MKDRIKELAVQARNYALDEKRIYERMHNTEQCMEEYREVYNKKFAELIVRECMRESMAEIVSDENIEQESDPLLREYLKGNNGGIVDAVVRFRNHFGVEE